MTLQEKFAPFMYCFMGSGMLSNTQDEDVVQWNADKCEKIADEYAIGFADWFFEHWYEDQVGYYEAADLLEKYKKEKGL